MDGSIGGHQLGPDVLWWDLCSQPSTWHSWEKTRIILVPCSLHKWEQVQTEHKCQAWRSPETPWWMLSSSIIEHDRFGGGSVRWVLGRHRPPCQSSAPNIKLPHYYFKGWSHFHGDTLCVHRGVGLCAWDTWVTERRRESKVKLMQPNEYAVISTVKKKKKCNISWSVLTLWRTAKNESMCGKYGYTSVTIFNVNNSCINIWCVIKVYHFF